MEKSENCFSLRMELLWYYYEMIRYLIITSMFTLLILLNACNTVTGTVEGTTTGIVRDVKTIHHYSTCIFTDTQCGDLNLK